MQAKNTCILFFIFERWGMSFIIYFSSLHFRHNLLFTFSFILFLIYVISLYVVFHGFNSLYHSCSFFVTKERTKKVSLLKKLNGSVPNKFATCSACGNSLRSDILRQMLQVPLYLKFSPVF